MLAAAIAHILKQSFNCITSLWLLIAGDALIKKGKILYLLQILQEFILR